MHLLLIPSWYSTPANPIRGSFFREQAVMLRKAGHTVTLLAPPTKLRSRHGLQESLAGWRTPPAVTLSDADGLMTYRLDWWGWRGLLSRPARGDLALRLFDRICAERGKPNILHGHSILYGGWLAAYIGARRSIPAVLTEHSSLFIRRLIWPDQWSLIRAALHGVQHRFAVSQALADALRRYAPDQPIEVLANPVDLDFFAYQPPPPAPPFAFALLAGLNPNKGVDVLLRAFAALGAETAILRIAGDGTERRRLERLAAELGLTGRVEFLGRLPREGARDLIQRSHAVISASYVETFGVTLIEAFACGRPVVATRSGGPAFLVEPRNGILTPPGDAVALAAALRQMMNDYSRYDGAAIRAGCAARYGAAAIVGRLESVYRELSGNERI
jgi:glycosyltransferase involved in cell wall biosynthesis